MSIQAFSKRHPVVTYFVLTFVLSWGSILTVAGPGVILGTRKIADVLLPFVYLAMLVGSSSASLLLIGLVDGRVGWQATAPVAGGQALVCNRASADPTLGDGGQPWARALLACFSSRHRHDRQQGVPIPVWSLSGATGWYLRGARLDRVCHPPTAVAIRAHVILVACTGCLHRHWPCVYPVSPSSLGCNGSCAGQHFGR